MSRRNLSLCLRIVRLWHAGCATGEEVVFPGYLLYESGLYAQTRIYATDSNEKSPSKAKAATFPLAKMPYTALIIMPAGRAPWPNSMLPAEIWYLPGIIR